MTDAERLAERDQQLAAAREEVAALRCILERRGFQIDRMHDQLETALRDLRVLRKLLNRPPPDEPKPPTPPAAGADPGPSASGEAPGGPAETPPRGGRPRGSPRRKAKFGRSAIPAGLQRVADIQPPGPCARCGGTRYKALRSETVEFYDYKPAEVVVREVVRSTCRCLDCQHIATAPFPADLAPKLRATPGLICHVIFEKYGRHLPLHRVDDELGRRGASIPPATRDRWLRWAARWLAKLVPALKSEMFLLRLLHTDGTGFAVVTPASGRQLGQMAVYCNSVGTIYDFTSTKEGCHQRRFLGLEGNDGKPSPPGTLRFAGYQVADAASVADRTYSTGGIIECGCNGPSRRAPSRGCGPRLRPPSGPRRAGPCEPSGRGAPRRLRRPCQAQVRGGRVRGSAAGHRGAGVLGGTLRRRCRSEDDERRRPARAPATSLRPRRR